MRIPLFLLLLALLPVPLRAAEADTVGQALDQAHKVAKEAGVDLPKVERKDVDRLVSKAKEEIGKAQEKEKAKDQGQPGADKPGTIPNADLVVFNELPAWVPPVPGLKLDEKGAKGVADGIEKGKVHATAEAKPKELADTWAAKVPDGFKCVRKTSTDDGKTVEIVRFTSKSEPARWVEIKAEPGEGAGPTSVRLRYEAPVGKSAAPAQTEKK